MEEDSGKLNSEVQYVTLHDHFLEEYGKCTTISSNIILPAQNAIRAAVKRQVLLNKGIKLPTIESHTQYLCGTQPSGLHTELIVGDQGKITIWNSSSIINYTLDFGSFPNQQQYQAVISAFCGAANDWNAKFDGVSFVYTDAAANAHYIIKYSGTRTDNIIARADFPQSTKGQVIDVYAGFMTQTSEWQRNTMQHEIGHAMGLRHEFALTSETSDPAIQFGIQNALSIMSYDANRSIQDSDVCTIKVLYTLYPPSTIGTFPIVRISP